MGQINQKHFFAIGFLLLASLYTYGQTVEELRDAGMGKFAFSHDFEGAIQDFNAALDIDFKDHGSYYFRGLCKHRLKDYMGAMKDFNNAIRYGSEGPLDQYHNARGATKQALMDNRGAIEDHDKAIELNPEFGEAYFNRGNAKASLEDKKGAIADYTKAIELGYKTQAIYYNRGLCRIQIDEKNSGCLDLSKAGELGLEQSYELIKNFCQ